MVRIISYQQQQKPQQQLCNISNSTHLIYCAIVHCNSVFHIREIDSSHTSKFLQRKLIFVEYVTSNLRENDEKLI